MIVRERTGICYSRECSPMKHGRILMNKEWINNNITKYIVLMIMLCEKYHKDYMVGVRNYLEKNHNIISRIDSKVVISSIVDCKVKITAEW